MKRHQNGEVMLTVMAIMLVIVLFGGRHMGMMGHGCRDAGTAPEATQPRAADTSSTGASQSPRGNTGEPDR